MLPKSPWMSRWIETSGAANSRKHFVRRMGATLEGYRGGKTSPLMKGPQIHPLYLRSMAPLSGASLSRSRRYNGCVARMRIEIIETMKYWFVRKKKVRHLFLSLSKILICKICAISRCTFFLKIARILQTIQRNNDK